MALIARVLMVLSVLRSCYFCQGYRVSVQLKNAPVSVGSIAFLTCSVDPTPPGLLSYSWYTTAPPYTTLTNLGANATANIDTTHPKKGLYFCYVYSNGSKVAVGYTVIKPQGFLIPTGPSVVSFNFGSTIILQVNISQYSASRNYIQSLRWYKNRSPISVNKSCDARVCSDSMGTRLTIQKAAITDEGQYTVRIQKILNVNDSDQCTQTILSMLEEYNAAHSPVTFLVSSSSSVPDLVEETSVDMIYYADAKINPYLYIKDAVNVAFLQNQNNCSCVYCTAVSVIYFNGVVLYSSSVNYTIKLDSIEADSLRLYEVVFNKCIYFCSSSSYLWYVLFPAAQFFTTLEVQIYVAPIISLQAVSIGNQFSTGPIMLITCKALNGTPDVHNITLLKNGLKLKTVVKESTLEYNLTWNDSGMYTCDVESMYSMQQKSLILRESATAKFLLKFIDIPTYMCQNESRYTYAVASKIKDLTEILCSCTLSNDTFTQVTATCSSSNDFWVFTFWIHYTSDDGSMTAINLVSLIQSWLLDSACSCFAFDIFSSKLNRGCCEVNSCNTSTIQSPYFTFNTSDAKFASEIPVLIAGAIGGFIGGVLLTVCIGVCIIICMALMAKKVSDSNKAQREAECSYVASPKSEVRYTSEIEMEENAAYSVI